MYACMKIGYTMEETAVSYSAVGSLGNSSHQLKTLLLRVIRSDTHTQLIQWNDNANTESI